MPDKRQKRDKQNADPSDAPLRNDQGDLTPPHGDELRAEETFGRTDRYSNVDDADASREDTIGRAGEREPGASRNKDR